MANNIYKNAETRKKRTFPLIGESISRIKCLEENYLIIDPGIRNLCICNNKSIWLFHFNSIYDLLESNLFNSTVDSIIASSKLSRDNFDQSKNKNHGNKNVDWCQNHFSIICENQFIKRNILIQGLITGYIYNKFLTNNILVKFYWFDPKLKKTFLGNRLKYKYIKIKSNNQFLKQPIAFLNFIKNWSVYEFFNDQMTIKSFDDYKNIKKKDDIIDCLIMSFYLKYNN